MKRNWKVGDLFIYQHNYENYDYDEEVNDEYRPYDGAICEAVRVAPAGVYFIDELTNIPDKFAYFAEMKELPEVPL